MRDKTAIVGIGQSSYGRFLPESQLQLGAIALKSALADAGLRREDIDGMAIHLGWPLGVDYDRAAETYGLDLRWVTQTWLHGRFITSMMQQAAMAVACGLANVVACFTAISFTRERQILGGPGDIEGAREEGGTHGESPPYGLTAPAGGSALAMQRYMHVYGATSEELAAVPIAFRKHALKSPHAVMKEPLTLEAHQRSRMVVDPLHLYDCSLITDGAAVVLITSAERAGDLKPRPVYLSGMQGMRCGRDEFIFAPRGLGINQQRNAQSKPEDLVYRMAGIERKDVDALYTYDAFSPLVLFTLERFGFCAPGEAAKWVQKGRIELGGELPMNTSGGLLSEAHIGGWNSILEMVRQLRGTAGERQMKNARHLQWATAWGDSVMLHA
ncbi:MAG: thiolase family protein [Burkholderiales bacterium]